MDKESKHGGNVVLFRIFATIWGGGVAFAALRGLLRGQHTYTIDRHRILLTAPQEVALATSFMLLLSSGFLVFAIRSSLLKNRWFIAWWVGSVLIGLIGLDYIA